LIINPFNPLPTIVNDEGRVLWMPSSPEPAANLLRFFLDAVQRPGASPSPDWRPLPSNPELCEYAVWLTGALIDDVAGDSLDKRSVRLHDLQGWSEELRMRAVLEHPADWVAVTRDEAVFDRLINRRQLLEQLGQHVVSRT
jgi:hypothetical protein